MIGASTQSLTFNLFDLVFLKNLAPNHNNSHFYMYPTIIQRKAQQSMTPVSKRVVMVLRKI